ncbi:uncharacterized protein LOC131239582 [Magnolia sinica]|uniref:uncharacterized protein LOC131239582 n=1 Tax=Magnolia sinica TaxID=86752 RepID=UPI0026599EBD|nr:uncharacterized protein LOC131239582 [Magnolia sinica]
MVLHPIKYTNTNKPQKPQQKNITTTKPLIPPHFLSYQDMSTALGPLSLLLLLISAFTTINGASSSPGVVVNGSDLMVPLIEPGTGSMVLNETRRRLGSFQICALCTCCGGPKGLCLPSPCCYAINCNIPNRPFGFCSFTPKTCNCFGCHL